MLNLYVTYSYTYYTFDQLFSQNNSKCKDCNLFECSYNFSRELLTREQNHYFYRALFFTHKQTPTTRDLNTKSDKIKKLYQTHLSCYHFLFSSFHHFSSNFFYLIYWIIRRDTRINSVYIYIMYTALSV